MADHEVTDAAVTFDSVFSSYERSPHLRDLFGAVLDDALPQEVESFSFVPLTALRAIAAAVGVRAGELLADLACGRGGPGMWVARATGARLVGVDISQVAVGQARRRAGTFGLEGRAEFLAADLTATGLGDASVDGVMCIDAFQFADPARAAQELRRILRPGRRLALTGWEPRHPGDQDLPDRFTHHSLREILEHAGLEPLAVEEHPEWEERRRAVYEAALATDAGSDAGLLSLQQEAEQSLPHMSQLRRVLIVAGRPS